METKINPLGNRFRGYLPVIVDIETAGFNAKKNPLLEIAAVIVEQDEDGWLQITEKHHCNIVPFKNSELDEAALKFTGIDPYHPFRMALDEKEALNKLFVPIRSAVKRNECKRAILVGHNPAFDINFLNAAIERTQHKRSPFHPAQFANNKQSNSLISPYLCNQASTLPTLSRSFNPTIFWNPLCF